MSWSKLAVSLAVLAIAPTSTVAFPLWPRATSLSASDHCGDYDYVILPGTPWIVYNMLYDAAQIVGSQCTGYVGQTTSSSGAAEVLWNSTTDIEYVESTDNAPKGYSFVGLTENLETRITDISSIPAIYEWTRTNTTTFKGNVCFDFMTNDIKGDSTSNSSHELMLWLEYEGGQLPIGWGNGVAGTVDDLFGTSWKLYEDYNTDTGILVSSLLPDKQFDGSFTGDLKDWLEAMVTLGLFKESTYVNVGNAGYVTFFSN